MDSKTLNRQAQALVDRLTSGIDDSNGKGFMSAAIYDTAWVSMVSKAVGDSRTWLFPQCFTYLLQQQGEDGSWASYASQIDGILNTAASLLSLVRHRSNAFQMSDLSQEDLLNRISRATTALQELLNAWDVAATIHVGFEILVPAMLEYLQSENIVLDFQGKETLMQIRDQKMLKFRPDYLYGKVQLTALHSLEAFVGKIDFDRVQHHKINGSFMASPSSTAASLMNATKWDDDCEHFLRHVIAYATGQRSGGVPSAFPSTIFELTWAVSTLLEGGFDLATIAPYHADKVTSFLGKCFMEGKGTVGFAPGLGADADDTSKTILILNLLDKPTSPTSLLHAFETDHYFKTYPLERDPSFSANCNVLIALLHVQDVHQYTTQIEKVTRFLLAKWRDDGFALRDKWNISPFYSLMLMSQGMARLLQVWNQGSLPTLPDDLKTQVIGLLVDVARYVVHTANVNGSWGTRNSREETSYAILALVGSLGDHTTYEFDEQVKSVISRSRQFLLSTGLSKPDHLWVEKVTYASEILLQSYVLAALNIPFPVAYDATASNGKHLTKNHASINDTNGSHYGNGVQPKTNSPTKHSFTEHGHVSRNGVFDHNAKTLSSNGAHTNGYHIQDVRPNDQRSVNAETGGQHSESTNGTGSTTGGDFIVPEWSAQKEDILLGPYHYLENKPGKDMRSQLIAAFNQWLQVPPERLAIIEKVIKMLHTASLLVDDIEDNSDLRRGIPVAHSIFGIPQTFNSGNYVYFLALQEIRTLENSKAVDIFIEELIKLHRGQGLDLFWRDSLTCPSEEEYLEMVANKTGGLFSLAVRLMQAESPTNRDCVPLVTLLGLQFQIVDDYLNLLSTAYTKNKGLCEDLTEGKFSFPVIHSIRSNPENRELINILKQKTRDADIKKYAVQYMESTGSFEYSRKIVAELKGKALHLIDNCEAEGWEEASGIRKLIERMDISRQ